MPKQDMHSLNLTLQANAVFCVCTKSLISCCFGVLILAAGLCCRQIPYQFRVLVFSAILVALAGLLVGLPVYGSLVAAKWGDTSAVTAVNMPRVRSGCRVHLC